MCHCVVIALPLRCRFPFHCHCICHCIAALSYPSSLLADVQFTPRGAIAARQFLHTSYNFKTTSKLHRIIQAMDLACEHGSQMTTTDSFLPRSFRRRTPCERVAKLHSTGSFYTGTSQKAQRLDPSTLFLCVRTNTQKRVSRVCRACRSALDGEWRHTKTCSLATAWPPSTHTYTHFPTTYPDIPAANPHRQPPSYRTRDAYHH